MDDACTVADSEIEGALDQHVRDNGGGVPARTILVAEELDGPDRLLRCTDGPADTVPVLKQLVDDMGALVPVGTRHKYERTGAQHTGCWCRRKAWAGIVWWGWSWEGYRHWAPGCRLDAGESAVVSGIAAGVRGWGD